MSKLTSILISTRTMAVLFVVYIISMAAATFIEDAYTTATAHRLVYDATWFEILQLLLILNFIGNIKRYRLTQRKKWPVLVFHLSFILLFIGGLVSRFLGYEGIMKIREGQTQNIILSDKSYLKLYITDATDALKYNDVPTRFAQMPSSFQWLNTHFDAKYSFKNQPLSLRCLDFVPRAKDSLLKTVNGDPILHLVSTSESGRDNIYLKNGDSKNINGLLVGYNIQDPPPTMVNILEQKGELYIYSPIPAIFRVMATQKEGVLEANQLSPLNLRSLYSIGNTQLVVPEGIQKGEIVTYAGDKKKDQGLEDMVLMELNMNGKQKKARIFGGKNNTQSQMIQFDNKNFWIGYGAKEIMTDFAIKLRDFQLERYPGSPSPSSYASEVSLIDNGKETPYRIYMNHVLDYKGYRFFQSSFDPDEKGTILSVNHDFWGTTITYLGYGLLFLGLIFTLFWKGTHFWKLNQKLKELSKRKVATASLILIGFVGYSQHIPQNENFKKIIEDSMKFDSEFTDEFGRLQVQNYDGRIMPMNTLALDLLRKLTKKEKFYNLDANQWMIAVNALPNTFWINVPMIKVGKKGGEKLKELTNANDEGYCRLVDLLKVDKDGNFVYVIEDDYQKAFNKKPSQQTNYDKEVISLNEKVYIMDNLLSRQYLKMIPIKNDPNDTWSAGIDNAKVVTDSIANSLLNDYLGNAVYAIAKIKPWSGTQEPIKQIHEFQEKWGKNVIIPQSKVDLEIFYNKANAFFYLMIAYAIIAMLLLFSGFAQYFSNYKSWVWIQNLSLIALFFAMIIHVIFLGVRWYISGHAPWSNGYEAVMFIAFIGVASGFVLYKNSNAFIPMAGCIIAVLLMGFAHGGDLLDPQITPLVPVLKSYWLMIHVAIITSSYGFFGMACILGMLVLISYILTNTKNKQKIKLSTDEMRIVIELSLTVGIALLAIGTFLGGIWANESWGRYWSWDPKETWAYISIIVYAFVLHMRLVPSLRGNFPFVCMSILAFSSVIMTYFGVNYYLSGLHSYATGDPIPIPTWVYVCTAIVFTTMVLSRIQYNKFFRNLVIE